MRRGKRRKLDRDEPCIWEDDTGIAVVVKGQKEHRFAHGEPIANLIAVRERLKKRAKAATPPRAGSLSADAAGYLKTISDKRKLQNAVGYCTHWTSALDSDGVAFGEKSRFALTKLKIEQIVAGWLRANISASSCKKRLSALSAIFDKNNSDDEVNPVLKIKRPKEPDREPRAQPMELLARILAEMSDRGRAGKGEKRPTVSHSKVAMIFMMYTSIPPAQIERIKPATDIDWKARNDDGEIQTALRRRPRRKGKGTKETWTLLEPPAVDALKQLIAIGMTAEGTLKKLDRHSMANAWRRACEKIIIEQIAAGETPLPHVIETKKGRERYVTTTHPYDLRHSFLTFLLKESGNLAGVQEHAQHSTPRQTMDYVGAAIPETARQVSKAIRNRLPIVGKAKPAGTEQEKS